MPRICKPKPPTVPVSAYFHFPPHVWDAISNYAFQHNRGPCDVMQDFIEVGLLEYLRWDRPLLARYNRMEAERAIFSPKTSIKTDEFYGG